LRAEGLEETGGSSDEDSDENSSEGKKGKALCNKAGVANPQLGGDQGADKGGLEKNPVTTTGRTLFTRRTSDGTEISGERALQKEKHGESHKVR
jgi:hypothetical protein